MRKIVILMSILVGTAFPQTIRTVCAAGCQYLPNQIQQAVNDAQPCDIITVDPASGMNTVSGLALPFKANSNGCPITIRTAAIYNLPDKVRVTPSNIPFMAALTDTAPNYSVLTAAPGAAFYRFEGILFRNIKGNPISNLIQFGTITDGRVPDNQVSMLPHDIEFDRCGFFGWPGLPGPYRGILANLGRMTVTNSYFSEIKGVNSESQGVGEWNGKGPFLFSNNHIEASTEGTIFGGAVPTIQGIRPKDLWFFGNEYQKRWSWKFTRGSAPPTGPCMADQIGGEWWADQSATGGVWTCVKGAWVQSDEPTFQTAIFEDPANFRSGTVDPTGPCGGAVPYKNTTTPSYWQCSSGVWATISLGQFAAIAGNSYWEKNHWELKNAERAIAEGNYLHQSWPGAQAQHGACALLNQVDNTNGKPPTFGEPSAVIANVRFENNQCDSVPWGVSNGVLNTTGYFQQIHDVSISNNLFTGLGNPTFSGGDSQFIQTGNTGKYAILHNTVIAQATNSGVTSDMNAPMYPSQEITFSGNILSWMHSGFYSEFGGAGNLWNAIDSTWAINRGFSFNVIVNSQGVAASAIGNNLFRKSDAPKYSGLVPCPTCAVASGGYENGGNNDVGFVNYAGGDFHLKPTSPYAGTWAHGFPAGADIDVVNWSIACAVAGCPNPYLDFRIRGVTATETSATLIYTAYDLNPCTITASTRPDLQNPVATLQDSRGGDQDGVLMVPGLSKATRYYYSITCNGYRRSGQFLTNF